ncbi:hypothetical protein [Streptomyces beihaiensis]|uniref:UL36 very large tegument protein n=1 Tax=Streptomyces beihaiensis TaxID=2984495 RepID=A0ABT3U4G1_9ACTN|nr:hypothetical protein [Streptomyces beihaiensis]MCX3064169.1 hypothetical protein [Streptomyces beihaiensis]
MTHGEQLPDRIEEFAACLRDLVARIDQDEGWCGVFWRRDPEGMRACLDGREVPPWDVVEALLQDLASVSGPQEAARVTVRVRPLHHASARAHDAAPGGREALIDRMDVMAGEQSYALDRSRTAATPEDAAWARDDYERATARIRELEARLAQLDAVGESGAAVPGARDDADRPLRGGERPATTGPHPSTKRRQGGRARASTRARPRGSARFAGLPQQEEPATTSLPDKEVDVAPKGARFAGAARRRSRPPAPRPPDESARRVVAEAVESLQRLREAGRTGEAHIVLVEAVHWPPAHLPLLAAALHRAGLGADWATLLWEAGSLPPDRLAAAAEALSAAGLAADGEQLLRQGMGTGTGRAPAEVADAVSRLAAQGRHHEAHALVDAYVSCRTPQECARAAQSDPGHLVPLIVEAARRVSDARYHDVLHALRVAGRTV